MTNRCPNCGAPCDSSTIQCEYCGTQLQQAPPPTEHTMPAHRPQSAGFSGREAALPIKNRILAAVLAIFLGGFGVHKFYLGKPKAGFWMLAFCWTYIPAAIGIIEGFIMLTASNAAFMRKYNCQTK